MLPTVKLGNTDITRLIVGGNPFSGNSHWSNERDWEMRDFFTGDKIKETLFHCEECGINTMLLRADMHIMRLIYEYRKEGGKMNWIAMTGSEFLSFDGHINQLMQYGPQAIYHHGSVTDSFFKQGKMDELNMKYFGEMYSNLEKSFNEINETLVANRDEIKTMAYNTQNGEDGTEVTEEK